MSKKKMAVKEACLRKKIKEFDKCVYFVNKNKMSNVK